MKAEPVQRSVAVVASYGERRDSFFADTLLAMLCAAARRSGHRAEMLRVYYDGHDAAADARVDARLREWLSERAVDVVVGERFVNVETFEAPGRVVVQVARGDAFDPVDGVHWVVGANPGRTRQGTTRRTPSVDELCLAWERLLTALAVGDDPARVPGVGRVDGDDLVLHAPLERPARVPAFDAVVAMDCIAEGDAPAVVRKTLFGNVGCPYGADPLALPHYARVRLPVERPVARLGCAFCALGGDYEKRPDAEVVARTLEQARFWTERVATVTELVLSDQHALRYLRALLLGARDLRPVRWLFAARSDSFVREAATVRAAVEAAVATGHTLEVYLTGFESFSDAELTRYNKGVTVAEQLEAVAAMRALSEEFPRAFRYGDARGHSLILWSPWTTPDDIADSVAVMRRAGLAELFHELGRNRLRLYRDLPIYYAAERDGALCDEWQEGDHGAARRKGYNTEHPWRFLDPRTRLCYALARALVARLGRDSEPAQLAAAADYARAVAPDDVPSTVARVLREVEALEAALREAPTRRYPAAHDVRGTNACNNGCAHCPNRARYVPDASLAARIDAARARPGPVRFAGREPTLWPDVAALVQRAAGDDRRPVWMVTNGRRFASAPFARELVQAGLTHATVKLFGPDAAVADAYTRDPGGHAQSLAGLRNLRAAGLRSVTARVVLHAHNLDDLSALPARLREGGATELQLDAPLDAIGLGALDRAAAAVRDLAAACRAAGLALVEGAR